MFLFLGWDGVLCGLWMDGREQKIEDGDGRAKASSWDGEWDKAKMIAKGRFFCNQILHIPFITNILARFFASKNFKEKSFQNQPLIP